MEESAVGRFKNLGATNKVIIEKSRGEVSLVEQDTIENVSWPIFFFNFILCNLLKVR